MQKKWYFNFKYIAAASALWAILVLFIFFINFFSSMDEHIEEYAETSLRDATTSIAQILLAEVQARWDTMALTSKYAEGVDELLNSPDLLCMMNRMRMTSDFSEVVAADRTGDSINTNNFRVGISDRDYFKKVLNGETVMSQMLKSKGGGENVFVFARPIYGNGGIQGILLATTKVENFEKSIELSLFEGNGFAYIFDKNGDILIRTSESMQPVVDDNIAKCLSQEDKIANVDNVMARTDIKNKCNSYFTFEADEDIYSAYFMPLGINNWYVISGVPYNYLKSQSNVLMRMALELCLGVLLAIIPIMIAILLVERSRKIALKDKNRELQWNKERFQIIASLSNSIIYEIDLLKRITIYPNEPQILGDNRFVEKGFPYSLLHLGYVHPDDEEAFSMMHKNIPPFTKRLSGEFRIKRKPDEYIWYRFDEVILSDENGKAVRSIGRALDIDKEKKHIELLKTRAQIDSGSGLLNKQATEFSVRKCVEDYMHGIHAMIVIDVDDFKAVNDSKGHLYGDKVIRDIGDILRHRFRSTDITGRIGGDEFLIFLCDIPDEHFVFEKIEEISNTVKILHKIGLSTGVAIYPRNGSSYKELFRYADMAMYDAKKSVNLIDKRM